MTMPPARYSISTDADSAGASKSTFTDARLSIQNSLEAGSRALTYRAIAAITIGSALEFFEFSVFSFFATLIGRQYFPAQSELSQLLLALATFGLGFVMRPLGGIVTPSCFVGRNHV